MVAATRQVQDMMELVTSLPKGDAESTSVAMGALVSLERVMRSVKADWGIAEEWMSCPLLEAGGAGELRHVAVAHALHVCVVNVHP